MKSSFQWKDNPSFLADYFSGNYRPPSLEPKRFHEFSAAKPKEHEMSFDKDGYGFLIKFARKAKGPFAAEHVTLAAMKAGIAPPDLRNWGKFFVQAAKDGYIRRAPVPFNRVMGNGSLTLGWVAT
jgi:hypothetical protein